jgi:hypothetical protein
VVSFALVAVWKKVDHFGSSHPPTEPETGDISTGVNSYQY